MNESPASRKIVYILPEYSSDTGSHFFHLYELLSDLPGLDIVTVVIKAAAGQNMPFRHYRLALPKAFRMLELLYVLVRERCSGRKIFYVHYSFSGAVGAWIIARLFGGSVYYWNAGMPWLYRRSWFEEKVFRFILRNTILVTGTAELKEEYRRKYVLDPGRIRVMPNWIAVERFSRKDRRTARKDLGLPEDVFIALFVHRLSRRKGADLIPAIAENVTKTFPNVMFLIAGDGPEKKNIEAELRVKGLMDCVRLIGEVAHKDVADYFAAADIFFMPSEEEGFPHVLLEAMAAGIPYVASDVGGVREITPPGLVPYLAPPRNVPEFCERMSDIIRRAPEERGVISRHEQEWVRRYDIAQARLRFQALFR